ncbi:hypothetical protein niasHS_002461 [Heterodera schachtii]|uniref:SEA domain-containing protein n=1 Tax=Heterodera schachtii TaxID=97005 RepID=A0ABD2KK11_HETSC
MSHPNQFNANSRHPSNGNLIPRSNRRSTETAYSSSASESAQSDSPARRNYEPGTGAHFMAQSGWSNRDQYGRPRQHSVAPVPTPSAVFPIFTPAPRQTHQQPLQQQRHVGNVPAQEEPHQIIFSDGPNYKRIYLFALVLVSLMLLSLIVVLVVLLLTNVLVFVGFSSSSAPSSDRLATALPLPPSLPPLPIPVEQPHLVTRTFECELYVLDQANQAYSDPNSFEQFQAQSIVQNALLSVMEHSSLRDLSPNVIVERIENSGADLHVTFRLSIVILEQQNAFQEQSVRNLLLSEAGLLEAYLNRTNVDRSRISVKRTN